MRVLIRRGAPVLALVLVGAVVAGVARGEKAAPTRTTVPSLVEPLVSGITTRPLISVGDKIGNYTFESIPDGIAIHRVNRNRADLYVNHETSLVPFPANLSDVTNALLSRLTFDRARADFTSGSYPIPSSANFQRFCSNFLAWKEHGFGRPVVLTNEEATDVVNRNGQAFPLAGGSNPEQAGLVVAYDIQNKRYRGVPSMGRHNHENAVAIPGYKVSVILSGDDTFNAPASQMYMYLTKGANGVMNNSGALYAFKSDDPAVVDYGDLLPGRSLTGTFIRVPVNIASGDQNALEAWSNQHGVFQFIRIEDIAYDKNTTNVVYFTDTGEPRAIHDPATGRLRRGPSGTRGPYPNGRIFKMTLDRQNPLRVTGLSVLIDGDAKGPASAGDVSLMHNPDTIETTKRAILIQEDPGSQNQYPAGTAGGVNARIWRYDLRTGSLVAVAQANQRALDPAAPMGNWETSGIVDASAVFGPGWFFTNVQAHSVFVTQERRDGITFKREHGQLVLIRIPGT